MRHRLPSIAAFLLVGLCTAAQPVATPSPAPSADTTPNHMLLRAGTQMRSAASWYQGAVACLVVGGVGAWYFAANVPDQPDLPWIVGGVGLGLGLSLSIAGGAQLHSAGTSMRWAAYKGATIGEHSTEPTH